MAALPAWSRDSQTALALLLLLSGCGGGEDSEAGDSGAPTAATADQYMALGGAVQAYSDAYLTGRSEVAYAMLSARCQERHPQQEFDTLVSAAAAAYGKPLPIVGFEAEISGNMARVTYSYADASINQTAEPWSMEDGEWRQDDC